MSLYFTRGNSIPAGSQHFQTTLSMTYDGQTFNVQIEAGIHSATGQVYATFQSIDPSTGLPPANALIGFLPPENGTGDGSGYLTYSVSPKTTTPTDTVISSVAYISFDDGEPIATNQVSDTDPSLGTNPALDAPVTVDANTPTAQVNPLPAAVAPTFFVSWSGTDGDGSGIASYTVYVSSNGGQTYAPWLTNTTQTSGTFTGVVGTQYSFYVVATSNVGTVQQVNPQTASVSTSVGPTPTITITSVPPFGSTGLLTGTVSGGDFSQYNVETYLYVAGAGWWSKTTTPINADGTFSANLASVEGGSDEVAEVFCAALVSGTPAAVGGAVQVPTGYAAIAYQEQFGKTLTFAGHTWAVKKSLSPVGPYVSPGPGNYFSDDASNVWVDSAGLHLTVQREGGQWYSTEVILLDHLGNGTYAFQTNSRTDQLDPNLTFGMFTWDDYGDNTSGGSPNREIDIEDSLWGVTSGSNTQYVVQPYQVAGNRYQFDLPDLSVNPALTRVFSWQPETMGFWTLQGTQPPSAYLTGTADWTYTADSSVSHYVPTPGREYVHMNLWLSGTTGAPANGQSAEVVITGFNFVPLQYPVLSVQEPTGTPLTSGSSTVAFGSALVGDSNQLTFTILNSGSANATFGALTIDGSNPSDFSVVASFASPLASGSSTTFVVGFAPSGAGTRNATLHIPSNAPLTPSFDIELSGSGTLSSNADLSNLVLSSGTLTPAFTSGTLGYTTNVKNSTSSITVTPTVANSFATVTVNGTTVASGSASAPISLSVGNNTVTTVVTAQDGVTTMTYTVTVHRDSTDATLSALTLSVGTLSPVFASGTTAYTASVPYTTTSTTLSATANNAGANVSGNIGVQALAVGPNVLSVVVTAENGNTLTYTVTVTRAAPSTNANLSNLVLSSGTLTPSFASGTLSYTATVKNSISSITVTPTVVDSTATLTVNGSFVASGSASAPISLSVGNNAITTVVTAQNGVTTMTYTVTVHRDSADATLSALTLSSGTLSPGFASGTMTYTASVPYTTTSTTVSATPNNAAAIVSGSIGVQSLAVGPNVMSILVTAENGNTLTYTVTVTRAAPSTNANLSGLSLSAGTLAPAFGSAIASYTATVSYATTSVTVTPTVADATATVTVNGSAVDSGSASEPISLSVGNNTVTTVVTAQDGVTMMTYTVTVHRDSTDATLSALTLSAGTLSPVFASGTTTYTASVPYTTTSTTVSATANNAGANVSGSIGVQTLTVGPNVLSILVTAENGDTLTYTVTVTRAAPSTNASLSGLSLSAGRFAPAFGSDVTSYTDIVSGATTSITVTPTVADPTATVTVNGSAVDFGSASEPINLSVGDNTVTTVVTAQDGATTMTYTVVVTRGNAQLSVVVAKDDPAPGVSGGKFLLADSPAVDTYGDVAFKAFISGTSAKAGIGTTNNVGIWYYTGTNGVLIARTGTYAEGKSAAMFSSLSDPAMHAEGSLAFVGGLKGGDVLRNKSNASGIWLAGSGTTSLVVRSGAAAADEPGVTYSLFAEIVTQQASAVAFLAKLSGENVKPASNLGLWGVDLSGTLDSILRTGELITTGSTEQNVKAINVFETSADEKGQSRSVDTLGGHLTLGLSFTDKTSAIAVATPLSSGFDLESLVETKDIDVPGVPFSQWSAFGNPAVNANGTVAFRGTVLSTSTAARITASNDTGIWLDSGTTMTLVARTSGTAPGAGGAVFASLQEPVLNNTDQIAFIGSLKPARNLVTAATSAGIWANTSGTTSLVAREGDAAAGVTDGKFAAFEQIVLPDVGGPIFLAKLTGVKASMNTGIWSIDAEGQTHLLLQTGDVADVHGVSKVIKSISIFTVCPQVAGQSRNFDAATRTVVFLATFSDGTWAILQAVAP